KTRILRCGLKNLGNTCYSNSCLQALFLSNKIRRYFLKNGGAENGAFHDTLCKLFQQMQKQNSDASSSCAVIKPEEFNREFRRARPQFVRNEQHDAQEFLTMLLELVHNERNQAVKSQSRSNEPKSAQEAWS